jgi:hypothetical protein
VERLLVFKKYGRDSFLSFLSEARAKATIFGAVKRKKEREYFLINHEKRHCRELLDKPLRDYQAEHSERSGGSRRAFVAKYEQQCQASTTQARMWSNRIYMFVFTGLTFTSEQALHFRSTRSERAVARYEANAKRT